MIKVVWVMGNNFSGSTFFGLMLGNHPKTVDVGEVLHLDGKGSHECLRCGRTPNCSLVKVVSGKFIIDWYENISRIEGKQNIIDSSKIPSWWNRLITAGILNDERYDIKPVLLYKDPCRYIGSVVKHRFATVKRDKTFKESFDFGVRQFVNVQRRLLEICKMANGMVINYHRLASVPASTVKDVCEYTGLPYQPDMHKFWNNKHNHSIGGNIGARYAMKPKIPLPPIFISKRDDFGHYIEGREKIFLDNTYLDRKSVV